MTQPLLRVTVVQPALAKYRVPVFRELAKRPGIDLTVLYGDVDNLQNVAAEGFVAIPSLRWERKITGQYVMYQADEWKCCTRSISDVVVLRWTSRSVSLLLAMIRARLNGIPIVLWGHGYSKSERAGWRTVRNWIAKHAAAIVFYEPRTRDVYVREGFDPNKLFVAINSIDHTEIDAARRWWNERPDELTRFRRDNNLDQGPVILYVSRLQPANRVDLLVEATAKLTPQIEGLRTVIIGSGDAEKRRLESLAAELGVADNVVFRDGIYDELQLAPWFLSANVFCYPENIGLSLLHAFWYGLPVITSDNVEGQNPEIVALSDGVNGLLYQDKNMESLVATLRSALTGAVSTSEMSSAARKTVADGFTIPKMVDGLESAIEYAASTSTSNRYVQSRPARIGTS